MSALQDSASIDSFLTTKVTDLLSLKGRVVVITGGGRGIGLAAGFGVAEAGGQVAILDILPQPHQHFQKLEEICSKARYYVSDVTDYDRLKGTFEQIASDFGRIDGLITAAGIDVDQPFLEREPDSVRRLFDINILGTYFAAQLATAQMVKQRRLPGAAGAGSIVMIASLSAVQATTGQNESDYCCSKGAVWSLSRELGVELARSGVRSNTISPGYIKTDMTVSAAIPPELAATFLSECPMKRMADRTELKGAFVYLLSDASSFMTGGDMLITGGMHAGRS